LVERTVHQTYVPYLETGTKQGVLQISLWNINQSHPIANCASSSPAGC